MNFTVEPAKSSRSRCKGTGELIPEGDPRVVYLVQHPRNPDANMEERYSVDYFFENWARENRRKLHSADQFTISELKESDQEKLKGKIEKLFPKAASKRTRGPGQSGDPKPKKQKLGTDPTMVGPSESGDDEVTPPGRPDYVTQAYPFEVPKDLKDFGIRWKLEQISIGGRVAPTHEVNFKVNNVRICTFKLGTRKGYFPKNVYLTGGEELSSSGGNTRVNLMIVEENIRETSAAGSDDENEGNSKKEEFIDVMSGFCDQAQRSLPQKEGTLLCKVKRDVLGSIYANAADIFGSEISLKGFKEMWKKCDARFKMENADWNVPSDCTWSLVAKKAKIPITLTIRRFRGPPPLYLVSSFFHELCHLVRHVVIAHHLHWGSQAEQFAPLISDYLSATSSEAQLDAEQRLADVFGTATMIPYNTPAVTVGFQPREHLQSVLKTRTVRGASGKLQVVEPLGCVGLDPHSGFILQNIVWGGVFALLQVSVAAGQKGTIINMEEDKFVDGVTIRTWGDENTELQRKGFVLVKLIGESGHQLYFKYQNVIYKLQFKDGIINKFKISRPASHTRGSEELSTPRPRAIFRGLRRPVDAPVDADNEGNDGRKGKPESV